MLNKLFAQPISEQYATHNLQQIVVVFVSRPDELI
jgi:hypothetical protein